MAAIVNRRCPLWVISGHDVIKSRCPLYPQKRTFAERIGMSALCHKLTHAPHQLHPLLLQEIAIRQQGRRALAAAQREAIRFDRQELTNSAGTSRSGDDPGLAQCFGLTVLEVANVSSRNCR